MENIRNISNTIEKPRTERANGDFEFVVKAGAISMRLSLLGELSAFLQPVHVTVMLRATNEPTLLYGGCFSSERRPR